MGTGFGNRAKGPRECERNTPSSGLLPGEKNLSGKYRARRRKRGQKNEEGGRKGKSRLANRNGDTYLDKTGRGKDP